MRSLGLAFSQVTNKDQAWQDLHRLTQDRNCEVRWEAVGALVTAFSQVTNKDQAWQDLIRLTQDEDRDVRMRAAEALVTAFSQVTNKDQAWQDLIKFLIRLTQEVDSYVRVGAAVSLRLAFSQVTNKDQAWQDLIRLTQDGNRDVRWEAAEALVTAFSQVTNKDQAWQDLIRLTQDEDRLVRCYAYYALGRGSIFEATRAIDSYKFKEWLEIAIEYFDKSSMEVESSTKIRSEINSLTDIEYINPASFCLPFYRSLQGILFMDRSGEEEIQRYLNEARKAVRESEIKEGLLDAVENLSKALQEARSYTLEMIIQRSKAYTRYCIQTADCLNEVKTKAPNAFKIVNVIAVEKGIPIIDDRIKSLFREVAEAAEWLCKRSRGTSQEELDRSTYDKTRGLKQVESPIDAELYFDELAPLLVAHINRLPRQSQAYFTNKFQSANNATLKGRYELVRDILEAALIQGENDDRSAEEYRTILEILKNIEFSFAKRQSLSSMELRQALTSVQADVNNLDRTLQSQGKSLEELGSLLEERDSTEFERLENLKGDLIKTIESFVARYPSREDIEEILKEVQSLKVPKKRETVGLIGDISSIVALGLAIIAIL